MRKLIIFFIKNNKPICFFKDVAVNTEAETIQKIAEQYQLRSYNLSFIVDNFENKYNAEYNLSREDAISREDLIR